MTRMIPLEKQSKARQREYHAARRGSWNGVNPVTRRVESKKVYRRKKALKWEDDLPFQGFLLSEKIPSCRREQQHNENRKICAAF